MFPDSFSIKPLIRIIVSYSEKQWQPTPVPLPGKSHGRRSLVGCSPWGRYESDTTEWLHFHFSLSCIREGNGNPLQCSCLENPRDGEPGRLPSMGSHRIGHDWSDLAAALRMPSLKMLSLTDTWSMRRSLSSKEPSRWPFRQKEQHVQKPWGWKELELF